MISDEQALYDHIVIDSKKVITLEQELVNKLSPNRKRILQTQINVLRTRITQAVTDLYRLTTIDLEAVDNNNLYFTEQTEV